MIEVSRETPRQDDLVALVRQSDELMQSLYPAESNHLVDIDSLAQPHVHVFVAREEGRALGCGAFVLGSDGQAEMKRVFVERGPFGAYQPDPLSLFMEKRLASPETRVG